MSRLFAILFVAWLLFGNGLSTLQGLLAQPQIASAPQAIVTGAQRLLTPQPTSVPPGVAQAGAPLLPPAQIAVAARPVSAVVVPQPLPTSTPIPLPTVAPPIPLDRGEYQFIDLGERVAQRYCVRVPALGKQVCDQDSSMLSEVTQQFLARAMKLGQVKGAPIQ